jgi:hypothetical protein
MFVTLDGFIAGPNGEFDAFDPSEEELTVGNEFFRSVDGFLFGRVTCQIPHGYAGGLGNHAWI